MWIHWLIVALYFSCLFVLGAWGLHRIVLLTWLRMPAPKTDRAVDWSPAVLVQIPLFNEAAVAQRVIDAVARLDWPKLHIQVLDDSTDETSLIVDTRVKYWAGRGINITHIQRGSRAGYKAGALAHGLTLSDASFVAIFDADFIPEATFLRCMMPDLYDDQVGMVQACWGHINRDQNWLTRTQALLLDGHFVIEHTARFRAGRFFNFNGTAGIWRRAAIEDAGGWSHDTITEDLDLSYRAQLKHWRFIYREDVLAPAEFPATMRAFLTQQHRWAKGTVQTAKKLLRRIVSAPLPASIRIEATNHLTMVAAYPIVLLLTVLLPPSIVAREAVFSADLRLIDLFAVLATSGSVGCFYAATMKHAGMSIRRHWRNIPAAMAIGVGCSASQSIAVMEGLFGDDTTFVRTPKQGAVMGPVIAPKNVPLPMLLSCMMAAYYVISICWALGEGYWMSLPFMLLFGAGYIAVSWRLWIEGSRTVEAAEMDTAHAAK